MTQHYTGFPVPRHTVFALKNGTPVVQWDDNKVQDLLTGEYLEFDRKEVSHTITDVELDQLISAGSVEHYNQQFVWLYSLTSKKRSKS
jgi:hypothetical protein